MTLAPLESAAVPKSASLNRIPSLDGLRAISIFLVVLLHTLQHRGMTHPVWRGWNAIFNGASGVFIFFEISGFLITSLLLKEDAKRGSVSLKGFYIRRVFRILTPLYVYIGVVMLLGAAGLLVVARIDVISAAFFFHNIMGGPTWALEHLWSISVEEQFYLVWPFILVFALRKKGVAGRLAACVFPAAVIVLSPIARMAMRFSGGPALKTAAVHYLRFDFIMFGCLLALLEGMPRFERVYRASTRPWWGPLAVIAVSNVLSEYAKNYYDLTVGYTISGFAIAIFMLWCTRNAGSIVGVFLNNRVVAKIGVLSYSIYLWQTLFLHDGNQRVFAWAPWLTEWPWTWLAIVAVGFASYYIVEQPSLRARDRMLGWVRAYRAGLKA